MHSKERPVIGITGPSNSGKSTIADIFQSKGFAIVALADPMKRFIKSCFRISDEVLWGSSEERNKNIDVTATWWSTSFDRVASSSWELLTEVIPLEMTASSSLKLYNWIINLQKSYPNKISARILLQSLGDDWGRSINPLLWSQYAHKMIYKLLTDTGRDDEGWRRYYPSLGLVRASKIKALYHGAVIPDQRRQDEVDATKQRDGYVIKLNRKSLESRQLVIGIANHPSEQEWLNMRDEDFHKVLNIEEGSNALDNAFKEIYEWMKENSLGHYKSLL